MFTQPVFIRKNTSELRKKLEELGYVYDKNILINIYSYSCLYTYWHPNLGGLYGGITGYIDSCINCGTNEDLFLALAAFRDDSDINQWFVHKSGAHWINCEEDSFTEYYPTINEDEELLLEDWHKATVEELIERFEN